MRIHHRILAGAVAMAATFQASFAGELIFRFDGYVVDTSLSRQPWASVGIGQPAWLEYTFDLATPDAIPGIENNAFYAGAISSFTVSFGAMTVSGVGGDISVSNEEPDSGGADFYGVSGMFLPDNFEIRVAMFDLSATAFSSAVLPTTLSLSDWDFSQSQVVDNEQGGSVDAAWLSFTVIPAPGTAAMFILAACFARRRREPRLGVRV